MSADNGYVLPNPQRMAQIADPEKVPLYRRLDCRSYNRCLSVASDEGWPGFTCNDCQAHSPMSGTEQLADMEAMASLLAEIPRRRSGD